MSTIKELADGLATAGSAEPSAQAGPMDPILSAVQANLNEDAEIEADLFQGKNPLAFDLDGRPNVASEVLTVYHEKKAEAEDHRQRDDFEQFVAWRVAHRDIEKADHVVEVAFARLQFERDMQTIYLANDDLLAGVRARELEATERLDVLKSCAVLVHHQRGDGSTQDLYGVWQADAWGARDQKGHVPGIYVDFATGQAFDAQTQAEFEKAHPDDPDHQHVLTWDEVQQTRQEQSDWHRLGDDIESDNATARREAADAGDDPDAQAAAEKRAAQREIERKATIQQILHTRQVAAADSPSDASIGFQTRLSETATGLNPNSSTNTERIDDFSIGMKSESSHATTAALAAPTEHFNAQAQAPALSAAPADSNSSADMGSQGTANLKNAPAVIAAPTR